MKQDFTPLVNILIQNNRENLQDLFLVQFFEKFYQEALVNSKVVAISSGVFSTTIYSNLLEYLESFNILFIDLVKTILYSEQAKELELQGLKLEGIVRKPNNLIDITYVALKV